MDERVLIYESTLTEIADAIREKRETEEEIQVTDMAEEILAIQVGVDTSDGTAAAEDVLVDKVAYVNEQRVVGTMANNGAVDVELSAGESYSVPVGYHDGEGVVRAKDLASQTEASAAGEDILSGQTAWVDGEQITGTMVNNGAVAPSALAAGGSYTIPQGYHDGSGKVTVQSLATITSGGTVTSGSQILSGYKAYSDGTLYTGSMANQGAPTKTLNAGDIWNIPAGYYSGGKITAATLAAQGAVYGKELSQTISSSNSNHVNYMYTKGLTWNFGFMPDIVICWNDIDVVSSSLSKVFSGALFVRSYPVCALSYKDFRGTGINHFTFTEVSSSYPIKIEWTSTGCRIYSTESNGRGSNAEVDGAYHCIAAQYT